MTLIYTSMKMILNHCNVHGYRRKNFTTNGQAFLYWDVNLKFYTSGAYMNLKFYKRRAYMKSFDSLLKSIYGNTYDILLDRGSKIEGEFIAFNNTKRALKLLFKHIKMQSRIVFHTDVDVDGIGTNYIFSRTLGYLGSKNHEFIMNTDKEHGVNYSHIGYFRGNGVGLVIITDSSCNSMDIMDRFECDVLCVDHHDFLGGDTYRETRINGTVYQRIIVNNTIDSDTCDEDLEWIRSINKYELNNIKPYKSDKDMSCGLVVYELLRVFCSMLNRDKLLENAKLYQWAAVTLFTDSVNLLNARNQRYIANTVFSMDVESTLYSIMKQLSKYNTMPTKSFINFSFAPVINKAIRANAGMSAIETVMYNANKIQALKLFDVYQSEAIEKATTTVFNGVRYKNIFNTKTIMLDISKFGISKNYTGVIASRLCGNNGKSAAVYISDNNGNCIGSFRGKSKSRDYRKYFDEYSSDVYAQGHPLAFGFRLPIELLKVIMNDIGILDSVDDKVILSAGNTDKRGEYHIDDLVEFRRQGNLHKMAMINSRVTSNDEIYILVSRRDAILESQQGKVYNYDVLGLKCVAMSLLDADDYIIYPEYGKELRLYLKER